MNYVILVIYMSYVTSLKLISILVNINWVSQIQCLYPCYRFYINFGGLN